MKARIQGVAAQMQKFEFFFGISLGQLVLRHSDNLSRTLQKADISAAEGQDVTAMTVTVLQSLRTADKFDLFFVRVRAAASQHDIEEPRLPRKRMVPRRLDDGSAPAAFPASVEDHYRPIYHEALDLITACIQDRFNQPGYKTYCSVQSLLLKAAAKLP